MSPTQRGRPRRTTRRAPAEEEPEGTVLGSLAHFSPDRVKREQECGHALTVPEFVPVSVGGDPRKPFHEPEFTVKGSSDELGGAHREIRHSGRVAARVLSAHTRVGTTTDSVFEIGSITKLWTATLVQQLVREDVLNLDQPARNHLFGFQLKGREATDTKFAATLTDKEHLLPPGTLHSYSDTGFTVLGRLVEVLRDRHFHDVLRERLITPLGLKAIAVDTYEAILHRTAVGHVQTTPTKQWAVSYRTTPSGSHLAMSGHELLTFVHHHLTDPTLAPLREHQLDVPDFGGGVVAWGLGWMRYPGGIVGHTGVSKGQKAFLRVDPSANRAVAVLTNSTNGDPLAHDIFTAAGFDPAPMPTPPANPAPIDDRMCGTYRTPLHDITLTRTSLTHEPRTELGKSFRDNTPVDCC
ncbi:serine hydrolase domain-containing protein [Lentzea sp. NPDC006480]|uniref:serine hydrolase domain-containing protein n=1 Tax=Lentzea sp. NPDC006480 TaxID=3157176 RepID=UPI0033BDAD27